jgi:hypothetical protein
MQTYIFKKNIFINCHLIRVNLKSSLHMASVTLWYVFIRVTLYKYFMIIIFLFSDPLGGDSGMSTEPVFGPSLKFAGQAARWTGDSSSFMGQKGIEARVSFDAFAGDRVTSFLEIVNDGTTCIYYDWKVC